MSLGCNCKLSLYFSTFRCHTFLPSWDNYVIAICLFMNCEPDNNIFFQENCCLHQDVFSAAFFGVQAVALFCSSLLAWLMLSNFRVQVRKIHYFIFRIHLFISNFRFILLSQFALLCILYSRTCYDTGKVAFQDRWLFIEGSIVHKRPFWGIHSCLP